MSAKFSIIIPVYNVAPYLCECLDSVLAQTFVDWEAICVDDGSTDESGVILDEYGKKDARFRVIHQENAGVSAARNAALGVANGEWILFLDADDVWSARCLNAIRNVQLLYSSAHLIRFKSADFSDKVDFGAEDKTAHVATIDTSKEISMSDFFDTLLWGYAYRRDVVEGRRFPPYRRGEDRVFLNGIQLSSVRFIHETDDVLYGYRLRQGSAMRSVPSTQVILDEMDHRRDIVKMIEASSKKVVYAGSSWLEGYFIDSVGRLIASKPLEDRERLWSEWFACINEMRKAKGLSRRTKCIYWVCCKLRYRPVWWLLCRAWPWYNTHGILPRVVRKVLRYVH